MVRTLTAEDEVILLISGGGSALFEYPTEGVTLEDIADATRQLLACGADITEINCIRKRLSGVKGGRKKASVQWKKNATGKGYELQLSRKKSFSSIDKKVTVKKNTTVKATVKGLKKGKYYVRIRTVNGSARSDWSKVQTVKVS
jgi:hypothetical protein